MEAYDQLRNHQQQADMEGVFVTVSRQALDEVLDEFDKLKQRPITIDIAPGVAMLQDEKVARKMSELMAPALVQADPFSSLATIIDATVPDPNKKKILEHNLGIFQVKLKEAQHAH